MKYKLNRKRKAQNETDVIGLISHCTKDIIKTCTQNIQTSAYGSYFSLTIGNHSVFCGRRDYFYLIGYVNLYCLDVIAKELINVDDLSLSFDTADKIILIICVLRHLVCNDTLIDDVMKNIASIAIRII